MTFPDLSFESKIWKRGGEFIVGLDEVGRGALAGPVVCAGVVFPNNNNLKRLSKKFQVRVDDSKRLTRGQREKADNWIRKNALAISINSISAKKIDRSGISKATHSGFRRSVKGVQEQLGHPVNFILIDAFFIPYLRNFPLTRYNRRQRAIIDGDAKSFTIAAASIVAKVYRDKLMKKLGKDKKYQKYDWGKNKGYGTKSHLLAIKKHELTSYHRKSFISIDI